MQTHMLIHIQYSLFSVLIFYDVTTNTELENTGKLLRGHIQVWFLQVSDHNIWSIHNFVLDVFV